MYYKGVIDQDWKDLVDVANHLQKRIDAKSVHSFRVLVKSLRANAKVVRGARSLNGLQPLYRLCGRIRDADVMMVNLRKTLQGFQIESTAAIQLLRSSRTTALRELRVFLAIDAFNEIRSCKIELNAVLSAYSNKELEGLLTDRIALLKRRARIAARGRKVAHNVHNIRKQLKEVQYLVAAQEKCKPKENGAADLEMVREIGTLLGSYHDNVVFIEWIEKSEDLFSKTTKRSLCKVLKQRMKAELEMSKQIIKQLS